MFQMGDGSRLLHNGEKDPAVRQGHPTGGLHRYDHPGLFDEYVYTVHCESGFSGVKPKVQLTGKTNAFHYKLHPSGERKQTAGKKNESDHSLYSRTLGIAALNHQTISPR